ncbi:MAG: dephospho-CoA kinase, partial [Clostridia bacterium]|nr:dephospho-CoA kinase [Clostridia bacterium]
FGIDTDLVYREITSSPSECLKALSEEFGTDILTPSGALDRRRLAEAVFMSEGAEERRLKLNEITHKYILDEVRKIISSLDAGYRGVIVDAPLLFESGFDRECDATVSVIADIELRIKRILLRDGVSEKEARRRIASQKSDEELKSLSDYIIVNNGNGDELRASVLRIAEEILNREG